jgi:REP element-mobilizing transposase RayT
MTDHSDRPARRSPRLQGYDYRQDGGYFVTLCTQNRVCLFGDISDDGLQLNAAGMMVALWWERLPEKFPGVELDAYVIMPNHLHGILVMGDNVGADTLIRPNETIPTLSLSTLLQWFKVMTTNAYIRGVREQHWDAFPGKLWQRSYYDHIIRAEADLHRIQVYIENNPTQWATDDDNPSRAR